MKISSKGFTLIELLLVIALVGILSAIAIPRVINYKAEAQEATLRASLSNIRTAIHNWRAHQIAIQNPPTGVIPNQFPPFVTDTLEGGIVPENPYNRFNGIYNYEGNTSNRPLAPEEEGNFGWIYNPLDGTFYANSNHCIASDPTCTVTANEL